MAEAEALDRESRARATKRLQDVVRLLPHKMAKGQKSARANLWSALSKAGPDQVLDLVLSAMKVSEVFEQGFGPNADDLGGLSEGEADTLREMRGHLLKILAPKDRTILR